MSLTLVTVDVLTNAMILIGIRIQGYPSSMKILTNIVFLFCALLPALDSSCVDRKSILEEITYDQLVTCLFSKINDVNSPLDMVVIDARSNEDYRSGYIFRAQNVPLSSILDANGSLIDRGSALKSIVEQKNTPLIVYGKGREDGLAFARSAQDLGYDEVYCYTGGIKDWENHDGFYVIEYDEFKKWHVANMPFENSDNYLVDILPALWYQGEYEDYPEGHIPCAVNIPIADWTDSRFNIVDDGYAFTSVVTNKDAKVVLYCGDPGCPKSPIGAMVASRLGYTDMFIYEGGQEDWIKKGEKTVTGKEPCQKDKW